MRPRGFSTNFEFETLLFLVYSTKFLSLEVNSNSSLSPEELTKYNETRRQNLFCAILGYCCQRADYLGRFELR